MADALALVEFQILHVCALPGNTSTVPGNCDMEDEPIAKWCADEKRVLVTLDSDFRTRWLKSGALVKHGVEVIVYDKDLKGLPTQHAQITRHLPFWHEVLGRGPYTHRVWVQRSHRNEPDLQVGPKPKGI